MSTGYKLQLYKMNAKSTGFAFNFQIDNRFDTPNFYINAAPQESWNGKTGTITKDQDKKLATKINALEAGAILSSFKTRIPWNTMHKYEENTTTFFLTPWDKNIRVKNAKGGIDDFTSPCFGLTIIRNGNQTFRISLEAGEVEALRLLLERFVDMSFGFELASNQNSRRQETSTQESAPEENKESDEDEAPF